AWCSIIGSSHILEGLPCQDSSKVEYVEDSDFIIAAISDGAGSCDNSQIGSSFLVSRAIEKMASMLKLNNWYIFR
ncbi:MAG: protein phosphatase 2C domain-containing protein, partial [Chitinophagaceae bacterium]|nr:protein phosphatase 2C domain-containing protein [Chitinophagaceae bacterium]